LWPPTSEHKPTPLSGQDKNKPVSIAQPAGE